MSNFLDSMSEKQFAAILVLGFKEYMPNYPREFARIDRFLRVVLGRLNVIEGKIPAFEKKRLAAQFSDRVGEAISNIQPCRMVALAETPPSLTSGVGMFTGYRYELELHSGQAPIKFVPSHRPTPALDNNRCVKRSRHRQATWPRRFDRSLTSRSVGFAEQNSQNCGSIDDYRGKPLSS